MVTVCRFQKLRTEVNWGLRQDTAACRANAAIRLAERSFVAAPALAAGKVLCRRRAAGSDAQSIGVGDLGNSRPDEGQGAAATEAAAPAQRLHDASASKGQWQSGTADDLTRDRSLMAYECPLFARKFPANTSEQVLTTLGELL